MFTLTCIFHQKSYFNLKRDVILIFKVKMYYPSASRGSRKVLLPFNRLLELLKGRSISTCYIYANPSFRAICNSFCKYKSLLILLYLGLQLGLGSRRTEHGLILNSGKLYSGTIAIAVGCRSINCLSA